MSRRRTLLPLTTAARLCAYQPAQVWVRRCAFASARYPVRHVNARALPIYFRDLGSNFRWFERSLLARCWSVVHCDGSLNAQRALHPNGQRPLLRPAHPTGPTHVSSTLTRWTLGACCLCPPSRTRVLCMCRECSPGPPLIGWPVRPCSNYISWISLVRSGQGGRL